MNGTRRGVGVLVVLVVVIVGAVLLFGSDTDRPFALDSAGPSGYKGLRLVLEGLGAEVDEIDVDRLGSQQADRSTAILVMGGGSATLDQANALIAAAQSGRTVVTAGPVDGLGVADPVEVDTLSTFSSGREVCDVDDLEVVQSLSDQPYVPLGVPDGAQSCLGDGVRAAVVSVDMGSGRIVTVASPWLFANDAMRPHDQEVDEPQMPMADNVVLAGRLLIRDEEGTPDRVLVVTGLGGGFVEGSTAVEDLLSPGVKLALWQLVAAFAWYAWWRGRRLGKPVLEPMPVTIAGSELVAATGNFRERQGDAFAAAHVLRRDVARELAERLGLPRDTRTEVVAAQVATRSGRDVNEVEGALWAWGVGSDADLVRVAAVLDAIRQEVTHV